MSARIGMRIMGYYINGMAGGTARVVGRASLTKASLVKKDY